MEFGFSQENDASSFLLVWDSIINFDLIFTNLSIVAFFYSIGVDTILHDGVTSC